MHRMIEVIHEVAMSEIYRFLVVRMRITRVIEMEKTRPLKAFSRKLMRRKSQLQLS